MPGSKSRRDPAIRQGSLLISTLAITPDEALPRFIAERLAHADEPSSSQEPSSQAPSSQAPSSQEPSSQETSSQPPPRKAVSTPMLTIDRVGQARDLLDLVIEALQARDEAPWLRLETAWRALMPSNELSDPAPLPVAPLASPPSSPLAGPPSSPFAAPPSSPSPWAPQLANAAGPPPAFHAARPSARGDLSAFSPLQPPAVHPAPTHPAPTHPAPAHPAPAHPAPAHPAPFQPPEMQPPPIEPPAGLLGGGDPTNIDSTQGLSLSMLDLDVMPFEPGGDGQHPQPIADAWGPHENAGETGYATPALADDALPWQDAPHLTLEQYAAVCAERQRGTPADVAASRYGIHDHVALDASWSARFADDESLRAQFDSLLASYRQWLDTSPP